MTRLMVIAVLVCSLVVVLACDPSDSGGSSVAITFFDPTTGPVGTTVSISGREFSPVPEQNRVLIGAVTATVVSASETLLVITIPQRAATGPFTVTVAGESITSDDSFVVTDTIDTRLADLQENANVSVVLFAAMEMISGDPETGITITTGDTIDIVWDGTSFSGSGSYSIAGMTYESGTQVVTVNGTVTPDGLTLLTFSASATADAVISGSNTRSWAKSIELKNVPFSSDDSLGFSFKSSGTQGDVVLVSVSYSLTQNDMVQGETQKQSTGETTWSEDSFVDVTFF